ncbi:hypothetical protein [Pseudonocardia oroxyli]|nr:hypothetical protein [Pseudonocardia oroxyli]
MLAVFFALSFGLVTVGVRLMYEAAGYVVGGILVGLWAFLAFTDPDGESQTKAKNQALRLGGFWLIGFVVAAAGVYVVGGMGPGLIATGVLVCLFSWLALSDSVETSRDGRGE